MHITFFFCVCPKSSLPRNEMVHDMSITQTCRVPYKIRKLFGLEKFLNTHKCVIKYENKLIWPIKFQKYSTNQWKMKMTNICTKIAKVCDADWYFLSGGTSSIVIFFIFLY